MERQQRKKTKLGTFFPNVRRQRWTSCRWLKWLLHSHPSLHLRQPLQPVPIQRYRHLQRIPLSPHLQKMSFLLPKVPLHLQKVARLCRLLAPLTTTTSCSSPSAPALFKTPWLSGEFRFVHNKPRFQVHLLIFRVLPGRIRVLGGMAPLTRCESSFDIS